MSPGNPRCPGTIKIPPRLKAPGINFAALCMNEIFANAYVEKQYTCISKYQISIFIKAVANACNLISILQEYFEKHVAIAKMYLN